MILASITPGEPCAVRAYSCARGSRLRMRLVDVKFDRTPDPFEVRDLQRRPRAFVEAADRDDVA